jgi:1-acyl-sn-glycerol-3-phosphate acyltransferase
VLRTIWVYSVVVLATLFFGTIVLVAAMLRVRGEIYSECTRRWARAIVRATGVTLTIEGAEHLRADIPQVLVSNHRSAFDIVALAALVPGRFAFVGKKELDSIPFFGRAWIAAGHISIDRANRQTAVATLQETGRRIRKEHATVIIFPEGTRSRTRELLPFKKGAFALALEADVAVLPTVLDGSERVVQNGRIRATPVKIRFGAPLRFVGVGERRLEDAIADTHARMRRMLHLAAHVEAGRES